MDKRDTLRNLLIAGAVFLLAVVWLPRLLPVPPQPTGQPGNNSLVEQGQTPLSTQTPNPDVTATLQTQPTSGQPTALTFVAIEAPAIETRSMGSGLVRDTSGSVVESPYRMHLTLSNIGASIEIATIADHEEELHSDERYKLLAMMEGINGEQFRSMAVRKINVDGVDVPLERKRWFVGEVEEAEDGQTLSFSIMIRKGDEDVIRVVRRFTLTKQTIASGQHDLKTELFVENLSAMPHTIVLTTLGGVGVRMIGPRMDDRTVNAGIRNNAGLVDGISATPGTVVSKKMIPLYTVSTAESGQRGVWAATGNKYFSCTIAPLDQQGGDAPTYITAMTAIDLDGSSETKEDISFELVTRAKSLVGGEKTVYRNDVFIGEKDAGAFRSVPAYAARNYYYQVTQSYGSCTFTSLVELMIWLLNGLHTVFRDFGIAIIVLVLIVRTLLHPITKKGQINMVRMQQKMQEMQPKIEEIKRKYSNDKVRMNQEMMKLNINPAGQMLTCLPMMIQMPIWVALWISLSNNILMRHEPFLFGLTWIHDLTAPDALIHFSSPITIPLFGWHLASFNLLPLLLSVAMFAQQKMQPKPAPNPNATQQQRDQQDMMKKMMPMMSIMMLLIFYNAPSGLTLYIMTSTIFGTLEQMRIRKHIREQEAAGTLHDPPKRRLFKERKRSGPSFFEKMQKMAEEAQKAQLSAKPKPKRKR